MNSTMINAGDILETIRMIQDECLDIRTVTMGISLLDCIDSDIDKACDKVYDKICRKAENHVKNCNIIEDEYGIPIINKRISVTPIAMLAAACEKENPVKFAKALERAAENCGVNFIGGYSALVQKGFSAGDLSLIHSIPEAMSETTRLCSSVNVGSSKSGINMDAVKIMGEIVKESAIITADRQCVGPSKIVVLCNAPEDNPFMAGSFHGVGEPDCVINVGVSGPGVVRATIAKYPDVSINELADIIKKTAFKITRMGQLVGARASKMLDIPFGIVDLSLAPTPAVGDSVARILEEMGLETCGTHGTTAALAMLNDAVKKGGVMASSNVGGLSGAFIPVSEDEGMIQAAMSGTLTLNKLEAMTAVCSVGLDMIAIPGDIDPTTISAIIADEMAIGMVNNKTTAVRLIPAIGKKEGDVLEFGGLFGSAPVMPIIDKSAAKFINRGGRIPAPMHSVKN